MAITTTESYTCYDAIEGLDEAMRGVLDPGQDYYVLGGIATGAIRDTESGIDAVSQIVFASDSSTESVVRSNGTRRDIDILVKDVLEDDQAQEIKETVSEVVGDLLVVSIFGFDKHEDEISPQGRFKSSVKDWVSRRTIADDGNLRYELHPLEQIVSKHSFEPWTLALPNGERVSILSPAGHVLAYAMRSISGIRHKDVEKIAAMTDRILADEVFESQIRSGIFREWLEFACAVYDLRDGRLNPRRPIIREESGLADRLAFQTKGRFLAALEGSDAITNFGQNETVQKILNIFVRAK
ncbi:MAG TPA: hypothetical protein VLE74_01325 [Candidatus Saccharimonadales bacterium]|nr:hypothetical protein [Candidatus Saccharimonadales bacterium]